MRSRWAAIGSFLLLGCLVLGIYLRHHDRAEPWRVLKVRLLVTAPFEDLQTITYSIDCSRQGVDPYVTPCDPLHRPLNYPPVWLRVSMLGFDAARSDELGWAFGVLGALGYILALRARTLLSSAAVVLAICCSRPYLLALEKGNTDEVVFFFLVAICFLTASRQPPVRTALRALGVVFLTCLKIYPVAACIAVIRNRLGLLWAGVTGFLAAATLVAVVGPRLRAIVSGTPIGIDPGVFGVMPLVAWPSVLLHRDTSWAVNHRSAESLAAALVLLAVAAAGWKLHEPLHRRLPMLETETPYGTIALACAGIYCFAYLGGSNFNYRLIFHTGVLGFLLFWFDQGRRSVLPFAALILLVLVVPGRLYQIHQGVELLLFLWYAAWIGAFLSRMFARREATVVA